MLPFCKAALVGRYPFDPGSVIDVNTADFARVFGPGGLIDGFTNDHLLPYVDTAARPWRWRADLGLDDGALAVARARPAHPRRALPGRRRADHDLHPRAEGPLAQRHRA